MQDEEKKNEDVKPESEIILALKEEYEKRLADKDKIIKSLISSKGSKSHEPEENEEDEDEEKAKKEAEEKRKKRMEYYKSHIY